MPNDWQDAWDETADDPERETPEPLPVQEDRPWEDPFAEDEEPEAGRKG